LSSPSNQRGEFLGNRGRVTNTKGENKKEEKLLHPPTQTPKNTTPKKHSTYLKCYLVKRGYLKTLLRKGEFLL